MARALRCEFEALTDELIHMEEVRTHSWLFQEDNGNDSNLHGLGGWMHCDPLFAILQASWDHMDRIGLSGLGMAHLGNDAFRPSDHELEKCDYNVHSDDANCTVGFESGKHVPASGCANLFKAAPVQSCMSLQLPTLQVTESLYHEHAYLDGGVASPITHVRATIHHLWQPNDPVKGGSCRSFLGSSLQPGLLPFQVDAREKQDSTRHRATAAYSNFPAESPVKGGSCRPFPVLSRFSPALHHCQKTHNGKTGRKVAFNPKVAFWFPAASQIELRTPVSYPPRALGYTAPQDRCIEHKPDRLTISLCDLISPEKSLATGDQDCVVDTHRHSENYRHDNPCRGDHASWLQPPGGWHPASSHLFDHTTPSGSTGDLHLCSSSVGLVSESSIIPAPPLFQYARRKTHSRHDVPRTGDGHSRKEPHSAREADGRLDASESARVADPVIAAFLKDPPNPYSSFDAVNGPSILIAEASWPTDRYITNALDNAQLPGRPNARFMRFELIDFPGPQIAITGDHGAGIFRAVVFDFRPFQGEVETIDTPLQATILDQVRRSHTIPNLHAALDSITGHACTTLANGVIVPPGHPLSTDADVVLFQIWHDGAPTVMWRPFQFSGDHEVPATAESEDATADTTVGTSTLVGATAQRPAAIPRYAPAFAISSEARYTYLDVIEGVQNRPKPPFGGDWACVDDALTHIRRRGTTVHARVISRPLHGLYLPQVLISRTMQAQGWQTIAIDLRSINLGIKVIDVRLGTSIRQLMDFDSPLQMELRQLGRGHLAFAYRMNLEPCLIDTAFHIHTDTISLAPFFEQEPSQPSVTSHAASARWRRHLTPAPSEFVTELSSQEEGDERFTVYDTFHHFRVMRRARDDAPEVLVARALSMTPEIPDAEGHIILQGIAELPFPQIILAPRSTTDCIVPLLYKVNPVTICTVSVPSKATAFEIAYAATRPCRALTGAHYQVARRTAAIIGHHGSADPFQPGCAVTHEVLVLRGYSFATSRARMRPSASDASQHQWIEARTLDPTDEPLLEEAGRIRVFVARGPPGAVHVDTAVTLKGINSYIKAVAPMEGPASLRWPTICPAIHGAVPMALLVSDEATMESQRWAIVDVRRVGHPPMRPIQAVPIPPIVDLTTVMELMRHELPTLRPIARVYLNDHRLGDSHVVAGDIMTITLMRQDSVTCSNLHHPEPALDINFDLLERRTALRVMLNRFSETDRHPALDSVSSRSDSISEADTDISVSFHSGTVDVEFEPPATLGVADIGTVTTGTHTITAVATQCQGQTRRRCFKCTTSTTTTGRMPRLTFFSSAGGCRPVQVYVSGVTHLHQVVARHTHELLCKGFLPTHATLFFSQRIYTVHGFGASVFLVTGNEDHSGQPTWCLSPQWHEPIAILLESFKYFDLADILSKVRWTGAPPPCVAVNGVRWDGRKRFFFSADVVQLATCHADLQTRPLLDLRLRMYEFQAVHFPAHGPSLQELRALPAEQVMRYLDRFFKKQFTAVGIHLGPWRPCPHVVIVGHSLPILRVSVGVPFAPTADMVQEFFDKHLEGHFSARQIIDTKWASHNAYVFFAAADWSHSCVWVTLIADEIDALELHADKHSLESIPAPEGYAYRPVESNGHLGIASLRRITDTELTHAPGFLSSMPRPPYATRIRTIDVEGDNIPIFRVPGTPTEHPPISSDSDGSPDRSSLQTLESDSSSCSSQPIELAPDISSPAIDDEAEYETRLSMREAFGDSSQESEASEGVHLLQRHVHISAVPANNVPAKSASNERAASLHVYHNRQIYHLAISSQASTAEVDATLVHAGCPATSVDLVPLQPMPLQGMHCLVRSGMPGCVSFLLRFEGKDRVCVADGESQVCEVIRTFVPNHLVASYAGHPIQHVSRIFDGMVIEATTPAGSIEEVTLRQVTGEKDAASAEHHSESGFVNLQGNAHCRLLNVGIERDMFNHVFAPLQLQSLNPDWQHVPDLPAVTRRFLHQFPVWDRRQKAEALQIFVDGSFEATSRDAAWAICVLVRVAGIWQWAGFFSQVTGENSCRDPLGFPCRHAHDAELYANIHALALIIAHGLPSLIAYDCESAAGIAQGRMQPSTRDLLSETALALSHLAMQRGITVRFGHVRSHQGHPLNEFVDRAAKLGRRGPAFCHPPCSNALAAAAKEGELQWFWMLHPNSIGIPAVNGNGHIVDEACHSLRKTCCPLDFAPEISSSTAQEPRVWHAKLVTYNCLSLRSPLQKQLLDRQFHGNKVAVAFLQETRCAACPKLLTEHYFGVASPCVNGQLGCQIWLHKSMSFVKDSTDAKWDPKSVAVLHTSPRALLITACAGRQPFALLSAHGPTAATPDEELQQWWHELHQITRKVPERSILLVGLDANARFSPQTTCTNEAEADGEAAVQMCRYMDLQTLVSSQLVDHCNRRVTTWISPNGKEACIDYVLVPKEFSHGFVTLGAIDGFEDLHERDHLPLCVELTWQCSARLKAPGFQINAAARPCNAFCLRSLLSHGTQM